jgi:predicted MFS family arabinose efflux permease
MLACAPLIACFLAPGLAVTVVLWAVSGLASAYHLPTSAAFVQAVPDAQRGQAFGVASTALKSSQGAGILLAGLIANESSPSVAIGVMGGLGTIAALAAGAAWSRARRSRAGTAENGAGRVAGDSGENTSGHAP